MIGMFREEYVNKIWNNCSTLSYYNYKEIHLYSLQSITKIKYDVIIYSMSHNISHLV